jgi:protein SCO1/2
VHVADVPNVLMRRRTATLIAVTASLVLAACAAPQDAGTVVGGNTGPYLGTNVDPPFPLPDAKFTNTQGGAVSVDTATDKPVTVVLFAYTNCPDVCNAQLAALSAALRRVDPEVRDQVGVVMITTDPARDDAEAMRAYLDAFGDGYEGLRADLDTTLAAGEPLGVFIERGDDTADGGYEVDHTAALFGFDAQGDGVVLWQPGVAVDDLVADLTRLVQA